MGLDKKIKKALEEYLKVLKAGKDNALQDNETRALKEFDKRIDRITLILEEIASK